jgi:hypothetical protein
MGQLVFQATLGGQVNLVGPNTASTFNLNVPAVASTLATTSGTETLTNKTLTSPTLTSPNITTALLLTSASGTSGQVLTSAGTGAAPTWTSASATPGGSTTQVQYNNAGAFGGISGVTTDGTRMTASTTIGVGAATPSTSGAGITFPATQSASTDANTLDDYEEGTWTPSVGGNATYTTQAGTYTKIGRLVHVRFILTINVIGTGSQLVISGLPFTESSGQQQPGSMGYFASLAASVVFIAPYVSGSGTSVAFNILTVAAATATNNPNILQNSSQVNCSAVYTTS